MSSRRTLCSLVSLVVFSTIGCSNGGGGGDGTTNDAPQPSQTRSDCGYSIDGQLVDGYSTGDSVRGTITEVRAGNPISVASEAGPILVQLPGAGITKAVDRQRFESALNRFSGKPVNVLLGATPCSQTYKDGVPGYVAHVVTDDGVDLSEYLVEQGVIRAIGSTNICETAEYRSCFSALIETTVPKSAGVITDFLWKPQSDGGFNPGMLVVLANPCNVDIFANGQLLVDFGESNGRCSTARSFEAGGCGFGRDVKVEIIDRETGAPYLFPGGEPYFIVSDGCQRTEFKL